MHFSLQKLLVQMTNPNLVESQVQPLSLHPQLVFAHQQQLR